MAVLLGKTITGAIASRIAESYDPEGLDPDITTTLTNLQNRVYQRVKDHVIEYEIQKAQREAASDFDL